MMKQDLTASQMLQMDLADAQCPAYVKPAPYTFASALEREHEKRLEAYRARMRKWERKLARRVSEQA